MPKLLSISEVINLEGEPIPMFKGVFKKVWDRKSGRKGNKKWTLNAGVIQDHKNEDVEADIVFWNRKGFDFEEGDSVVVVAEETSKGWTGVKCEYDEDRSKDKDRDIWKISINESASVMSMADFKELEEEGGTSRRSRRSSRDNDGGDEEKPKSRRTRRSDTDNEEGSVTDEVVIERLYQAGNLYLRCIGMAASVCELSSSNGGPKFSSEDTRCMATNFYMDLKKREVLAAMPNDKLELFGGEEETEPGESDTDGGRKKKGRGTSRSDDDKYPEED